jgi:hypothetical protein
MFSKQFQSKIISGTIVLIVVISSFFTQLESFIISLPIYDPGSISLNDLLSASKKFSQEPKNSQISESKQKYPETKTPTNHNDRGFQGKAGFLNMDDLEVPIENKFQPFSHQDDNRRDYDNGPHITINN